ncbi:chromosome condensation protein CrcB [Candidatus Bathyarchaeota archaeon RBG_13_52_12]|nr:MAG: chromosome condensation protein CrcB [Candidatus Bathyarchaeota archaeon RBG_13_52_12]
MNPIILVALGGAIGAVLRYILGGFVQSSFASFPFGTILINFTGTLTLGTIMYLSEYSGGIPPDARLFITIGVLGAYTSMSTFGYETFRLLESGETLNFALNFLATNILVLIGVYLGRALVLKLAGVY